MSGKWLGGLLGVAALLVAGAAWSQNSRANKSRHEPLISSIQGPALYKAYCASCHGADAKGNGPMAESLKIAPVDLTHISARNGGKFPLMRMERVILGEEELPSGHGTAEMPVWGPIFSQVDQDQDLGRVRVDNLARYLREIQEK